MRGNLPGAPASRRISVILLLIVSLFSTALRAQESGARYLIVTHDSYYTALQPLAEWKTQKGMKAKIVRLSETGTDSIQIRNYIVNAYNTWQIRPEYLLIVGNKYQVPFPRFMHVGSIVSHSDNYYANVSGDFHNELYHGRLWVSDTLEAQTVIGKILGYEKNPPLSPDPSWFRRGVTIANEWEQGAPSSAALYWADARYAHQFMFDAGYTHIDSFSYELGDDSADVLNAINDGRSYILYRGIGGGDWLWPFAGIYASQMSNGYEMPVVLSATCATVEGIGTEWTVAGTPSQPRGVIAFFGTTTSLYEAAEMRSALCRGTTACLFSDSGGLGVAAEAGRLEYYAQFSDLLEYHSWICLGDPEMKMWTYTPREILVGHNMYFHTGICTVNVYVEHNSTAVAGALVCLAAKRDTTFYHYGYTNRNGGIQFIDTLHIPGDSVYITVTGQNLKPYSNARPVLYTGGPCVQLFTWQLLDSIGGNGDGVANPGEDIEIPFTLKNWGDATAYGISAIIEKTTPDTLCTLYDTIRYCGNIAPYESVCVYPDGYNVVIDTNAPDEHEIRLCLRIRDSGSSLWTSDLTFMNRAPILSYHDHYFNDHLKYIPAGSVGPLYVELLNTGSGRAENVTAAITCSDSLITLIDSTASFGNILPDSVGPNQTDPFIIEAHPGIPAGYTTDITVCVVSGVSTATLNITIQVGQKDYLVWDPDPNHTSGPVIDSLLNSLAYYGDYSIDIPYDCLSLYRSIFICTGVYPYRYFISDTSQIGYEIDYYLQAQSGKTYLEGGDVWYNALVNHGYNFGQLFGIETISNSIGAFAGVDGCNGTFTQNMSFIYNGEATMIDYIDTTAGSQLIFKKSYSNYGCAVAADNRTVGLSFELSGLVDTIQPSTKAALLDSIMGYFGIPPTGVGELRSHGNTAVLLLSCWPNPFRSDVQIRYSILDAGYSMEKHTLVVYDAAGRVVKELNPVSNIKDQESVVHWDGTDSVGRLVPQGVYFIRLEAENTLQTIKTILLR
ncbi:MAG: T9SS type A sorting domain-containing protein [candidate division WOR-3 bacterium]|nr:MAG: T9SS type A sorting domain-containing protein [candidate division WOR-3 bacterium]